MKPRLYIETSFISYLTAKPSRDLIAAAHQAVAQAWWDKRRESFDLYCSQLVLREAGRGDPKAAELRLAKLKGIPLLDITPAVAELAEKILARHHLPAAAADDAIHIATAATHGMDYLLSLNFTHIVNAELLRPITEFCESIGIRAPAICSPEELMGDTDDQD